MYTVKHKGVQYAAGAAGSRDKAGGEHSAQSTLDSWRVPPDEQASQGDGLVSCMMHAYVSMLVYLCMNVCMDVMAE